MGSWVTVLLLLETLSSEDDYHYEFSVLSMRIRFVGRHFLSARAQNGKLVVLFVLRSKGSY